MSEKEVPPICGIVMPISAIDGCLASHWEEVLSILNEAIEDAGFTGNLVSNSDDAGIIQKRIIENLYDNPIVVCDVSGKNPNVMFELGMRLAFDKPTIIIKDDKTSYSFDTSPIEHLEYPRDLRFASIVAFKQKLAEKIKATHQRASTDSSYTTFLKNFGPFTVAKLDKKEVPGQEYILTELSEMRRAIQRLDTKPSIDKVDQSSRSEHYEADTTALLLIVPKLSEVQTRELFRFLRRLYGITRANFRPTIDGLNVQLNLYLPSGTNSTEVKEFVEEKVAEMLTK